MALDTYDGLIAAVSSHLDRDDLNSHIADFISLAEARHKREIRIREMLTRYEFEIADGDRYIDLPEDFLDHKYLRIGIPSSTSGRRFYPDLQELSIHQLSERSVHDAQRPCAFAIHEQIELDSEADQEYDAELFYYIQLTALSDDNQSNALLARAPDVYLYGALLASAPFLLNDERIPIWGGLYKDAKDTLNTSQNESRRGGPLIARVSGRTP